METQVYLINRKQGRIQKKSKGFVGFLLILFLILVIPVKKLSAGFADPDIPVKGVVVDSVSGEGISFVTIQIESNGNVVQRLASDASGKFSFALNTPGTYNILLHSVGYQMKKTAFKTSVPGNGFDFGKISLKPSNEQVKEVTISALKPLVRSEADKLVYNVESDPEAKTSNVLDMLQKVPLVSVDGNENVSIRGITKIKFLVNGKSSVLLDQNPKDVLRSMPTHTIKDIEVITNPSSKYEAEGAAGIINIITNRKTPDGFNGKINASINTLSRSSNNLYFATKANKFIISANANLNYWEGDNTLESHRENYFSNQTRYNVTSGNTDYKSTWLSIGSEASYELDSLNLFSLTISGAKSKGTNLSSSVFSGLDETNILISQFENSGNNKSDWKSFSAALDYQRSFHKKGRLFTFSYRSDLMPNSGMNNTEIVNLYNYPGYQQKIENDNHYTEQTLQIDYVDPINKKSQIETGFKQIWRRNDAMTDNFRYDEENDIWIRDDRRSNHFDYHQNVSGLYFTYQLKLKKALFKAGLRAENTTNKGVYESLTDTSFSDNMFNLVPYFLFSHDFKKGRNLKFSYTNRLSRPGIWYLNPYYNDSDPMNVNVGNPKLDSELSHSFDFSYNKFSDKFSFSLNTNASFSNNLIYDVSIVKPDGTRITTFGNIGDDHNVGGTAYASVKVNDKLTVNATIGLYYRDIKSNNGLNLENSGWTNSGKFNFFIKPWKNANILTGAGYTPSYYSLQTIYPHHIWSYITYQHDLFDKKLRLEVRLDGPFTKYLTVDYKTFNPSFYETYSYTQPARFLTFRCSWSFGQMKANVKKASRSISNDDLKQGGS